MSASRARRAPTPATRRPLLLPLGLVLVLSAAGWLRGTPSVRPQPAARAALRAAGERAAARRRRRVSALDGPTTHIGVGRRCSLTER